MSSLLRELRSVMPQRPVTFEESLLLAERQAELLLRVRGIGQWPVATEVIADLPFIRVAQRPMAPSAATKWIKPHWVVLLNADHEPERQRHALAHEFKHILDHPYVKLGRGRATERRCHAYAICDYFAHCLLVPKTWLRQAWTHGIQDLGELAELFDVSPGLIEARLLQTGLVDSTSLS